MDVSRLDAASRFFAHRRLSRRHVVAQSGAGLVAVAAHEATPEPAAPDAKRGPAMLFVQSFQAGMIAPKEGAEGRYTVTLEHGLGQTIYFSDRPDRIAGTNPTEGFLRGLGFPPDNPPNAALVMETGTGETDIAVVELFDPVYDPAGPTVTYEVTVLANWEDSLELGFTAAPSDLAALAPSFGAAHLFIDDCSDIDMLCVTWSVKSDDPDDLTKTVHGTIPSSDHDGYCYDWSMAGCYPCQPEFDSQRSAFTYWINKCNERFSACNWGCTLEGICSNGIRAECTSW